MAEKVAENEGTGNFSIAGVGLGMISGARRYGRCSSGSYKMPKYNSSKM